MSFGSVADTFLKSLLLLKLFSIPSVVESLESNEPSCTLHKPEQGHCLSENSKRYLLYEINPGEGFNLRRDVYIRIAPLVRSLNDVDKTLKWNLVLPPWGMLPHWRNSNPNTYLPWGAFFDLTEMKKYIPVLEYAEYLEEYGLDNSIDIIYHLQHFPFNQSETWTEKIEYGVDCESKPRYKKDTSTSLIKGNFWNQNVFAKRATCIALRGQASTLLKMILKTDFKSILFDRAEVILWDNYGDSTWWAARKSLVFAKHLPKISHEFLGVSKLIASNPSNQGRGAPGEYIAVHFRRSDFLLGGRRMPTIEGAAAQLVKLMSSLNLSNLFLATDATPTEITIFRSHMSTFSKSKIPDLRIVTYHCLDNLSEGECAIVDQILCSISKYFIGTEESTFTFRIFEEREIMGFGPNANFNYLCSDGSLDCKKATQWRMM